MAARIATDAASMSPSRTVSLRPSVSSDSLRSSLVTSSCITKSLAASAGGRWELDEGVKDRERRGKHDPEPDVESEAQRVERQPEVFLGHQLMHHEVPRGFGMRFGKPLLEASIPQSARIAQRIEDIGHACPLRIGDPVSLSTTAV